MIRINPDLILQSRGNSIADDILVAIEMKKSGRPDSEKASDRYRLRLMTKRRFDDIWSNDGMIYPKHVCGYRLGIYIEVDRTAREALIEYFKDGKRGEAKMKQY